MKSMNKSIRGLWTIAALLALLLMVGCRAFSPETPRVNKAPETFIVGAPVEHGGGYYHFHLYWLGTDADGRVEKFVWALTDTTIQVDYTSDDEENARFNPALDSSTLDIANWTTRTDSIFDFAIHQGTLPSYDMTFHIVAMDDYGDYDRTPARLHFFSNTLGAPTLNFFRVDQDNGAFIPLGVENSDAVGFQRPYTLSWAGTTPNISGYDTLALGLVDTVLPFNDGLLGYKWQLNGALGGNCIPANEDCWHPRIYEEATGDSISFFGIGTQLNFANDNSGPGPFKEILESGSYSLMVNSIDVAGVEVPLFMRTFDLQVNFDPDTILLDNAVDLHHPNSPDSEQVYPYYYLLSEVRAGLEPVKHPFSSGDRIPDRTYVVFKAQGRDNPEDVIQDPTFNLGMTGFVEGRIEKENGAVFTFFTESSPVNYETAWPADENSEGWMADTLGFMVAPRTEFTIKMQSEDEHGRRDNTPAEFSFFVGYPPCLQGIELLLPADVSAFDETLACYEPGDIGHPCMDGSVTEFAITGGYIGDPNHFPDRQYLPHIGLRPLTYVVNPITLEVKIVEDPTEDAYIDFGKADVAPFRFKILIHGQDHEDEQWADPMYRILGIHFQVDYENDPFNRILDCWGPDQINVPLGGTYITSPVQVNNQANWEAVRAEEKNMQMININSGTWELRVDIAVPEELFNYGPQKYKDDVIGTGSNYGIFSGSGIDIELSEADVDFIFDQMIMQYGNGSVKALVIDQATNNSSFFPLSRPTLFRYFRGVRPPDWPLYGDQTWRHGSFTAPGETTLGMFEMRTSSGPFHDDAEIPTKLFNVVVHGTSIYTGEYWQYPPVVEGESHGSN